MAIRRKPSRSRLGARIASHETSNTTIIRSVVFLVLGGFKRDRQISHLPFHQRLEIEALLDQLEDRRGIVILVGDARAFEPLGDQQRRNASSWAPFIGRQLVFAVATIRRGGQMIPLAAELVVSDHDARIFAVWSFHDGADQVDEMVAAFGFVRVPGMLVLLANRFDEAHRLEPALSSRLDELRFVAQVSATSRGSYAEIGEVVERMVVKLEVD